MTKHDEPLKWVSEARVSLFDDEAINAVNNNIKYLAEKLKTTDPSQLRHDVIWTNKIKKIAIEKNVEKIDRNIFRSFFFEFPIFRFVKIPRTQI